MTMHFHKCSFFQIGKLHHYRYHRGRLQRPFCLPRSQPHSLGWGVLGFFPGTCGEAMYTRIAAHTVGHVWRQHRGLCRFRSSVTHKSSIASVANIFTLAEEIWTVQKPNLSWRPLGLIVWIRLRARPKSVEQWPLRVSRATCQCAVGTPTIPIPHTVQHVNPTCCHHVGFGSGTMAQGCTKPVL